MPARLQDVAGVYFDPDRQEASVRGQRELAGKRSPGEAAASRMLYSGMSLAELATLASSAGLRTERVYADTLTLDEFRERLKSNLGRPGDFVVANYDRRVLKQSGAGHISPVAAYDQARDAFLVLDEAAYRYPFTWIPASLFYEAVHTRSGDHFRGVLFISACDARD